MVRLTLEERGTPPLLVNPAHVVAIQPRKKLVPTQSSQQSGVALAYSGAMLVTVDGSHYNVVESFEDVTELFLPQLPTATTKKAT